MSASPPRQTHLLFWGMREWRKRASIVLAANENHCATVASCHRLSDRGSEVLDAAEEVSFAHGARERHNEGRIEGGTPAKKWTLMDMSRFRDFFSLAETFISSRAGFSSPIRYFCDVLCGWKRCLFSWDLFDRKRARDEGRKRQALARKDEDDNEMSIVLTAVVPFISGYAITRSIGSERVRPLR